MPGKPKIEESSKTKAVTRVFPRQLQLRKSMNIHLVSSQGQACIVEVLFV